jgi:hypothetical protein
VAEKQPTSRIEKRRTLLKLAFIAVAIGWLELAIGSSVLRGPSDFHVQLFFGFLVVSFSFSAAAASL